MFVDSLERIWLPPIRCAAGVLSARTFRQTIFHEQENHYFIETGSAILFKYKALQLKSNLLFVSWLPLQWRRTCKQIISDITIRAKDYNTS